MAGGRRSFLAGLLLGSALPVAAEAAPAEDLLVPAQFYGPPPRRNRRRRRCWIERRPVAFYDRFGRPRRRIVEREVCRRSGAAPRRRARGRRRRKGRLSTAPRSCARRGGVRA